MKLDLHVHSQHSHDAKGSVLELARAARAAGLDGFALTDHDTMAGHAEIGAAQEETGMVIVPGVEVTCAEGHLLGFGVHELPPGGQSLVDAIHAIEQQGGVAAPAHPLRGITGIGPRALARYLDALDVCESINARESRKKQQATAALVGSMKLAGLGGSDAHWVSDIGTAWTKLPNANANLSSILKALRVGDCFAGGSTTSRGKIWAHRAGLARRAVLRK